MKSDQVWWRPAGGAAAARRRARAINTRRPRPKAHGNSRSPPKIGGKTRMRAAHDKCHCETAQQDSFSGEIELRFAKICVKSVPGGGWHAGGALSDERGARARPPRPRARLSPHQAPGMSSGHLLLKVQLYQDYT
ncbi:unnamed protein product [Plutella xylostella]|uniref:(diamondback moth) hypothetical protein n=1 Tax=Plutella xylostella TaxID=51655 RepID=A0A8S4DI30_PLUXY|nr:unnamed protein product [Plutella xylostella]